MTYPQRPNSHELQSISKRFFENYLPRGRVLEEQKNDYGVDVKVDIFRDNQATGQELLVQLKSSAKASEQGTERLRLRISTYNYLWDKLQVVMLVKYVEEAKEAYYILLKNVPKPNKAQKTFTVHIPKNNKLSNLNWYDIQQYVEDVHSGKLNAWREQEVDK